MRPLAPMATAGIAALFLAATAATPAAIAEPVAETAPSAAATAFELADPRLRESSGLAASRRHDGVYYTHNDSGPEYGPDVYAIDDTGETVATLRLTGEGVEARDWEAIAVGVDESGEPAVHVADIGDNLDGGWPSVRIYRVAEPHELTDRTLPATTFTLTYADGARDAEGMLIDPRDNRLYIVSKELAGGIYAAPERLSEDTTNTLTRVGSAPPYATGASFAPDGATYAVRTYWNATVYDAAEGVPGEARRRVSLPEQEQGESLAHTSDGSALLVGSEGRRTPVWRVPLAGESPEPAPSLSPSQPPEGAAEGSAASGAAVAILTGVGVAAVVIAGIVVLARRG